MPLTAPTWTGATGAFTLAGKVVKVLNLYLVDAQTTYDTRKGYISGVFDTANYEYLAEGLTAITEQAKNRVDVAMAEHKALAERMLIDPLTFGPVLVLPANDPQAAYREFVRRFRDDSQSVLKSTITAGTVGSYTGNSGNGTVLTTTTLDGFNPPHDIYPADTGYVGYTSQLAATSETMTVECMTDSQSFGDLEGNETFRWAGGPRYYGYTWRPEGSGVRQNLINTVQKDSLLLNGTFEGGFNTTANVPDGWSIMTSGGTAGTHIYQETSNFYRGANAVKFTGDGAQATIGIQQSFFSSNTSRTPPNLNALRRYVLCLRYKASAVPAAGTLGAILTGTGYTAGAGESISIAAASLSTSWTLSSCFINLPASIPTDLALTLKVTGTLENGKSIYIDDVFFAPVYYFGGIGCVVVPGSTRFVRLDKLYWTMANNNASIWQTSFRRLCGRQLASVAAGNTIDEALAS